MKSLEDRKSAHWALSELKKVHGELQQAVEQEVLESLLGNHAKVDQSRLSIKILDPVRTLMKVGALELDESTAVTLDNGYAVEAVITINDTGQWTDYWCWWLAIANVVDATQWIIIKLEPTLNGSDWHVPDSHTVTKAQVAKEPSSPLRRGKQQLEEKLSARSQFLSILKSVLPDTYFTQLPEKAQRAHQSTMEGYLFSESIFCGRVTRQLRGQTGELSEKYIRIAGRMSEEGCNSHGRGNRNDSPLRKMPRTEEHGGTLAIQRRSSKMTIQAGDWIYFLNSSLPSVAQMQLKQVDEVDPEVERPFRIRFGVMEYGFDGRRFHNFGPEKPPDHLLDAKYVKMVRCTLPKNENDSAVDSDDSDDDGYDTVKLIKSKLASDEDREHLDFNLDVTAFPMGTEDEGMEDEGTAARGNPSHGSGRLVRCSAGELCRFVGELGNMIDPETQLVSHKCVRCKGLIHGCECGEPVLDRAGDEVIGQYTCHKCVLTDRSRKPSAADEQSGDTSNSGNVHGNDNPSPAVPDGDDVLLSRKPPPQSDPTFRDDKNVLMMRIDAGPRDYFDKYQIAAYWNMPVADSYEVPVRNQSASVTETVAVPLEWRPNKYHCRYCGIYEQNALNQSCVDNEKRLKYKQESANQKKLLRAHALFNKHPIVWQGSNERLNISPDMDENAKWKAVLANVLSLTDKKRKFDSKTKQGNTSHEYEDTRYDAFLESFRNDNEFKVTNVRFLGYIGRRIGLAQNFVMERVLRSTLGRDKGSMGCARLLLQEEGKLDVFFSDLRKIYLGFVLAAENRWDEIQELPLLKIYDLVQDVFVGFYHVESTVYIPQVLSHGL